MIINDDYFSKSQLIEMKFIKLHNIKKALLCFFKLFIITNDLF